MRPMDRLAQLDRDYGSWSQRALGFPWVAGAYILFAGARVPMIWEEDFIGATAWPGPAPWGWFYLVSAVLTAVALLNNNYKSVWFGLAMGVAVFGVGFRALVVHSTLGVNGILGTTNLMLVAALLTWAGQMQLQMRRSLRLRTPPRGS